MIGSTTCLNDYPGLKAEEFFGRTYSLTIVGNILFELMMSSNGETFSGRELVQHVEAEILSTYKVATVYNPKTDCHELVTEPNAYFQSEAGEALLTALYQAMLDQFWPLLATNLVARRSAMLRRINYHQMEISMNRLEYSDGS
ncbi:hypothetical protein [Xanthomonas phage RTH11]|nr:hypothetical protein [Xanthomonas phage RTH11]